MSSISLRIVFCLLLSCHLTLCLAGQDAETDCASVEASITCFLVQDSERRDLSRMEEAQHHQQMHSLSLQIANYQSLGRLDDALALLNAREKSIEYSSVFSRAIFYALKGSVLSQFGRLDDAEDVLSQAHRIAKANKLIPLYSSIQNEIGLLNIHFNDFDTAREAFKKARNYASSDTSGHMELKVILNQLKLSIREGKRRDFDADIVAMETRLAKSKQSDAELLVVGRTLQQLQPYQTGKVLLEESAEAYFYQVLARSEQSANSGYRMFSMGYLGELKASRGEYQGALALTQRAQVIAQENNIPSVRYRWEWQAARIFRQQGDFKRAVSAYQQSIDSLREVQQNLILAAPNNFNRIVKPLFFEAADLMLQLNGNEVNQQQRQINLRDVRDTVERLKLAEVEDYFQDECAVQQEQQSLEAFDKHSAVIYPILFDDRLEILVQDASGFSQYTSRVPADRVTRVARKLRLALQNGAPRSAYEVQSKQLYDWLVAPMVSRLHRQKIQTLVMVPDQIFRMVPLSALYDGSQFVGEQFAIATTPGLTLTKSSHQQQLKIRVMANGITTGVQGFEALPYVAEELQIIEKIYPTQVYQDESFTLKHIEKELVAGPYSIVHIATHGQFHRDHEKSFLLTYDNKLTMGRLQNILGLRKDRHQALDLLVLSACQTAAGDERAALGLAGIALQSGVRSALATLWSISDEATTRLVEVFYEKLGEEGTSKAKALQTAQRHLINSDKFSHPQYWAPFILVGNWL